MIGVNSGLSLLLHPDPGTPWTFGNLLEAGLVENSFTTLKFKKITGLSFAKLLTIIVG
jgi:hypothetical protein